MLEFETSARSKKQEKEREDSKIIFKLDGREMTAYPPKGTAFLILSASGASDNPAKQAAATLEFFEMMLEPDDYRHLLGRMKDSNDTFDTGDLLKIQRALLEELGGRPTE